MKIEQKTSVLISLLRSLPKILFVAAIYFIFAHFSLYLATLNNVASPVWPATGIAMMFVLLWGPQMAIGVFIGAVVTNTLTAAPIPVVLGIGVGNALECLAGVWIYHNFSKLAERLGPHVRLVVYVAVSTFATAISASVGTTCLILGNVILVDMARATWLTWWVGDTLGALILFPLAVKVSKQEFKPFEIPFKRIPYLGFIFACTLGLCGLVFATSFGAPYLFVIFLSLLLATIWFNSTWIYMTSVFICAFAIFSTRMRLGPFYGGNINENLLHLQLFLAGVGLTAIVLVTLKQERSLKIPSVALVFGWILTGMTFYSFYQGSVGNDQEHFDFQVERAEKELRDSLGDYIRLLENGSGLFAASEKVTREEWRAFTERLRFESQYPGVNGIGVIVPVNTKADLAKLVKYEKENGFPDFQLHEVSSTPPEMKVENPPLDLVVKFVEPIEKNRKAIGLLASSEKNRLEGALKARDTGLPVITSQVTLMQDTESRAGFVLFAPFYNRKMPLETVEQRRKAFQGLIYVPVIMQKFVTSNLGDYEHELDLKIYFGHDMDPKREVYSSTGWTLNEKQITKSTTSLGEMPVTMLWKRGSAFKTQSSIVASWAGFCGSLISIFLAIILSSLETITERAKKIAAETTRELSMRENELHVRQIALVASSRMSSLGQMASGMAHEINNPLAIISGKAQQLEFLVGQQPLNIEKAQQHILAINSNVERIAKIIRGLRSIARDVPNDPLREVGAKDIMQDTLELCRSRFKHHDVILIVPTEISPDMKINARPEQIVQVLLNLLNNAFDAVESLPEKWVKVDVEHAQRKILFTVTDSGRGLSEEVTDRIFDPFFTTKDVGKGTGLGLSISRGIIEKHQGRLYLDDHCENTKFVVELDSRGNYAKENTYS
ncbi:MAG: CHASE domain-containing protein [Bdellovibrionales bacterium]|nr:CHASE domain-containing protein [Bdellovibrionales bacterium]